MELIEEVRSWLIEEKIGLMSTAQLIQLVDDKILELDEPPEYLTKISLKERIDHVPRLDLIMDRVENKDCSAVARKMLKKLSEGKASFDDIGLCSLKMCQILGAQESPYIDFDWINAEVYLMNEGVKEKEKSREDIVNVLKELSAL